MKTLVIVIMLAAGVLMVMPAGAMDAASGNWGSYSPGFTGGTNNQSTFFNTSTRTSVVERGGSVNSVTGSTATVRGGFSKYSGNDKNGF